MYTSLPILLFPDNPIKVCRMLLRNFYVADRKQNSFFIKKDSLWVAVSNQEWYSSIQNTVNDYCNYYNWKAIDYETLTKAITFLFNDGICYRLYRYIGIKNEDTTYSPLSTSPNDNEIYSSSPTVYTESSNEIYDDE